MKETLQKIIDTAIKKGAHQADIIASKGNAINVKVENSTIANYSVHSSQVIGLRIIKDHKIGSSFCEVFDNQSIDLLVDQCLANAKFSQQDEFFSINVERKKDIISEPLHLNSKEKIEPKELVESALELEKLAKSSDKRISTVPHCVIVESTGTSFFANHLGTYCQEKAKTYSALISVLAQEGMEKSSFSHAEISSEFSQISFEHIVSESTKHAMLLLDAKPIKSGVYNVVFEINILASLIQCFSSIFSGQKTVEKLNPLASKYKQQIASPLLNLTDVPTYPQSFGFTSFDGEGNITHNLKLIEKGILCNYLQNTYTSKKLALPHSANAYRQSKSPLMTAASNLCIDRGVHTQIDFDQESYFYVLELSGIHSGHNPITGDFSFGAKGYLMERGEITHKVKLVTISGNYFELIKNIALLGNEILISRNKSFFAPQIMFSDLNIAGN